MKTIKIVKIVLSYIFSAISGVYALCLIEGEIDFFMVFGFVACLLLVAVTSPFLEWIFKPQGKGR